MLKKCRILLLAGMITVMSVTGCGASMASAEDHDGEMQTGETLESDGTGETEEAKETGEVSPDENEETDTDAVTITLSDEEELSANYTTAEGLVLPSGTRIAVVSQAIKGGYWKALQEGMQMAVDDLNEEAGYEGDDQITMTFEAPDSADDAESQINIVDAVLSENPQALCLAAIDMASFGAQLESAQENGIPVIAFNSSVLFDDLLVSACETENYEAGATAARRLIEKTGDFGEVLVVASAQDSEPVSERILGFESVLQNDYRTVTEAAVLYVNDSDETADIQERIQEIIAENPNVKGCFAADEEAAGELLDALGDEAGDSVQVVGFGAGKKQIKAIGDGRELGTICQNPYGMGYATVILAARSIMGLENDSVVHSGYQWIDSAAIDLEEYQIYLYD